MKKLLILTIGALGLMASNIQTELQIYTAQKYKVDFTKQNKEAQDRLKNEYEQTKKLSSKIYDEIKDDSNFIIAKDNLAINIWTQKTMALIKITEDDLKKAYEKEEPKALERVELRNILVKDEKTATKILNTLKKSKSAELIATFTKLVKEESEDITTRLKEGKLGWFDKVKLEKPLQDALKDKKKSDIIKVKLNELGWQIILIEDHQEERKATFDESKQYLDNLLRQQRLQEKINSLLK